MKQIVEKKGDYLISVKGNQPTLQAAVHEAFETSLAQESPTPTPTLLTTDNRRGRQETRCYTALPVPQHVPVFEEWKGAKSVVMASREHVDAKGQLQTGTRYFISSLPPEVKVLAQAVRGHWAIQNKSPWVLDMRSRGPQ